MSSTPTAFMRGQIGNTDDFDDEGISNGFDDEDTEIDPDDDDTDTDWDDFDEEQVDPDATTQCDD